MTEPLRIITQEESWQKELDVEIVELLEDALADAKQGKFDGIAVITTNKDGTCVHRWSKASSFTRMLGAIHRLAYRYNRDQD